MIVENSPSARMQVRSRGDLVAPGSCAVCGSGTCEAGYLDLGTFVEFHGTIYLCMTCCVQAGETVGLFTKDEVKHFQNQIESLLKENETLASELTHAQQYISDVNGLLQSKFQPNLVINVPVSGADEGAAGTNSGSDGRESGSQESITFDEPGGTAPIKLDDFT